MADETEPGESLPEGLKVFLAYHRRMMVFLTGVCAAVAVVLAVLVPGDFAIIGGFVTGAAAQLLKFGVLDVGVVRAMAVDAESAPMRQLKSRYGTMALLAVAIVVTLKFGFNVWALAAGVFLPRVIFLVDNLLRPNVFSGECPRPPSAAGDDKE